MKENRNIYFFVIAILVLLPFIPQTSGYHISGYYVDLNNNEINYEFFNGEWLLLEAFWTECGACKAQHPELGRIYDEYKDDINILSLAIYAQDDIATLNKYVLTYNTFWEIGWDEIGTFKDSYNIPGTPTLILFNPSGVEIFRFEEFTSFSKLSAAITNYVIEGKTVDYVDTVTEDESIQGSLIDDLFGSPIFQIIFFGGLIIMIYLKAISPKQDV